MIRAFLASELEGVATFWRIFRRDGVALAFTSHDRDLWFDGLLHRAAPGMIPSAIRRSARLDDDSAEIEGALTHDSISEADLLVGRYDRATIAVGVVDWESREYAVLYRGTLGEIAVSDGAYSADLRSAKSALDVDPVPRTSPLCRARFCGPGCSRNAALHTATAAVEATSEDLESVTFAGIDPALFLHGELVWLDGPMAGLRARIVDSGPDGLMLDQPVDVAPAPGTRARLLEGCDRTLATCSTRFGNSRNFRGEPFLPGNDMIARYGGAQ